MSSVCQNRISTWASDLVRTPVSTKVDRLQFDVPEGPKTPFVPVAGTDHLLAVLTQACFCPRTQERYGLLQRFAWDTQESSLDFTFFS